MPPNKVSASRLKTCTCVCVCLHVYVQTYVLCPCIHEFYANTSSICSVYRCVNVKFMYIFYDLRCLCIIFIYTYVHIHIPICIYIYIYSLSRIAYSYTVYVYTYIYIYIACRLYINAIVLLQLLQLISAPFTGHPVSCLSCRRAPR